MAADQKYAGLPGIKVDMYETAEGGAGGQLQLHRGGGEDLEAGGHGGGGRAQ